MRSPLHLACVALLVPLAASGQPASESQGLEVRILAAYERRGSAQAEERQEAEHALAELLFEKRLYGAARHQYSQISKAGPSHPYYLKAIQGLVSLSEVLEEDFITYALLDRDYGEEFRGLPPETVSRANYAVAVVSQRRGQTAEALAFLASVPPGSNHALKARYLQGIILSTTGKHVEALAAFEETLQATRGRADLQELTALAQLGLARTHFAMGRFADASKAYAAVPRDDAQWAEALLENAWAQFQAEDAGGALGSLHALKAPRFDDRFLPEAPVLEATVLFFACLFDESRQALEAFEKRYLPLKTAVEPLVAKDRGHAFYAALLDPNATGLPAPVRRELLSNRRLARVGAFARRLELEKRDIEKVFTWQGTALREEFVESVARSQRLAVQIAGSLVRKRLLDLVETVTAFDGKKDVIRFEIAKAEAAMLEARFDRKAQLAGQKLHRPALPGEIWDYWPHDGEVWPDEVGEYRATLKSGCMKAAP